ncbi:MAG: site-specific integrase [Alphaproteobacteria bacterium GM202ARS2]|nr:site-specific integrase [Alphaproteobacteria bacterium GM202ARS2]
MAYLAHRQSEVGQKQLDADRLALQFCRKVGELARLKTERVESKTGRAYTPVQIERIAARQAEHNGLATRIAYNAGLRAHELKTIRPADQGVPATHRAWRPDRFLGRTGERYLVTGKGGLVREVLLAHELARALEARRLDEPIPVTDRSLSYKAYYDIGGGAAWSQSVSSTSKRAFGWSTGAHGVRHTYVQERLRELQGRGYTYPVAKLVVSEELGHFREDVINNYLR